VELTICDETRVCGPGMGYHVPGGVPHGFRVLEEDLEFIEVFSPPKDENRG